MGEGESGGRLAAPIFRDFMTAALRNSEGLPFRIPQGVRFVDIDAETGCLPGPATKTIILEAFEPETEPTGRCENTNQGGAYDFDASFGGEGSPQELIGPDGLPIPMQPKPAEDLAIDDVF
jgi:penicillin-binding protein 1A